MAEVFIGGVLLPLFIHLIRSDVSVRRIPDLAIYQQHTDVITPRHSKEDNRRTGPPIESPSLWGTWVQIESLPMMHPGKR